MVRPLQTAYVPGLMILAGFCANTPQGPPVGPIPFDIQPRASLSDRRNGRTPQIVPDYPAQRFVPCASVASLLNMDMTKIPKGQDQPRRLFGCL
jgi:hypothetical protein